MRRSFSGASGSRTGMGGCSSGAGSVQMLRSVQRAVRAGGASSQEPFSHFNTTAAAAGNDSARRARKPPTTTTVIKGVASRFRPLRSLPRTICPFLLPLRLPPPGLRRPLFPMRHHRPTGGASTFWRKIEHKLFMMTWFLELFPPRTKYITQFSLFRSNFFNFPANYY